MNLVAKDGGGDGGVCVCVCMGVHVHVCAGTSVFFTTESALLPCTLNAG